MYPTGNQSAIAVRFSPTLFELRPEGPDPIIDLPYRMIFAVATDSDIIIYDTQQAAPFTYVQKIHYTRLTDVSWSLDSLLLSACSTDGYCTFVTFEPDELGIEYTKEESDVEESVLDVSGCEELPKEKEVVDVMVDVKAKKPSFLEQWTIKTPKKAEVEKITDSKKNDEGNNAIGEKKVCDKSDLAKKENINVLKPKRITPLKVVNDDTVSKQLPKVLTPKAGKKLSEAANKSPLLSFFKTSTPAKKIAPETERVPETIIIDEVALDAFPKECQQNSDTATANCIDLTEDDDFKLEYSNLTGSENEKSANDAKEEETHKEEATAKTELNVANKAINCKEKENSLQRNFEEIKVKKRIPLITLSSPKSKKIKK